ncbi:hypothetical protein [Flavobacterium phragmitis]|uniref:Uncharacterized protein n=1 Tax=Flavobacterium phragmitis TaxID=739143 RepID=A0A1I1WGN2_9FLAO|nr:hypothetical protein [Flavobacterium phragmitis]SFD94326.1 hypothetical protein SAMN05216297_11557 [Flavobacterium phragmitis]
MSTDYNRIKVADLETNEPDKILMTNSSGELEFNEISNLKVDSYNGLDYTQEGKVLDARQGKVLKDSQDNLNNSLNQKEDSSNKVQDIETNKNSTSAFPSIKSIYEWSKGIFKTWLLGIENFSSTAYTLNIENINKRTVFSSNNPVLLTVPLDSEVSLSIGTKKELTQKGNGVVTISGAGINFITDIPLTMVYGETRILTKIDTNVWTVQGSVSKDLTTVKDTYYISSMYGNDLTAVVGSQEKMFSTLNGAITHYKNNSPLLSQNVMTDYTFKIMDGKTYNLTQSVMQSYTGNVNFAQFARVKIVSDYACVINISNPSISNLIIMSDNLGIIQNFSRLYFVMPIGSITVSGNNPVQISQVSGNSTRQSYQVLGIKVANFNMNQLVNTTYFSLDCSASDPNYKQGTGFSFCEIDNLNITSPGTLIGAVHPEIHVKIKNINSTAPHNVIYILGNGTFSFKKITATTNFDLVSDIRGIINHGDIDCSYTNQFKYLGSAYTYGGGKSFVNYKNKCLVKGNMSIAGFNSTNCMIYLTGNDVTYENNTALVSAINIGEALPVQIEINIRKLNLSGSLITPGARNRSGVRLINTYLELNGVITNGFTFQIDTNNFTTNPILLESYGKCYINYLGNNGTQIVTCDYIPPSLPAFVNVYGDLTIYNGIISTSSNIVINKKTINATNY